MAKGSRGGKVSSSGKAGSGGKEKSNIPVITYATHSQKEQMTMEITNQFFNNYKKYGEGGQQANEMVIDGFLKEGIIDEEMANDLRTTNKKIKILESLDLSSKKSNKTENRGGLGMPPVYTAVTSTYKRYEKRRKKKFDDWWKGNHPKK